MKFIIFFALGLSFVSTEALSCNVAKTCLAFEKEDSALNEIYAKLGSPANSSAFVAYNNDKRKECDIEESVISKCLIAARSGDTAALATLSSANAKKYLCLAGFTSGRLGGIVKWDIQPDDADYAQKFWESQTQRSDERQPLADECK